MKYITSYPGVRSWARVFFILFFLLQASPSEGGLTDPKLKWYTLSTEHFNIHYYEGIEEAAYRMTVIAEKVYDELSKKFEWKPWGRIELVLSDTTDISNGLTTTLPYNYILLLIAPPQADSTLSYYDNWLEDLFRHELVHTMHLDMIGGIARPFRYIFGRIITPNGLTPGWVREGIATQVEGLTGKGRPNSSFSEMMMRTDILNDEFLTIDQMSGDIFKWPSYNAAYIYGGMFWTYLADTYGQDKVVEFSKRYSDSIWLFSLNNKARKTFGNKNFLKLKTEWKNFLTEKYTKQKNEIEAKGRTQLTEIYRNKKGSINNPTLSPDGKKLIYTRTHYFKPTQIRMHNLETGEDTKIKKGGGNQFSFSPDGKKVVYSTISLYKRYYRYFDIYEIDLETKKSKRLTQGKRAFHPDYAPDGKNLVYVGNKLTSTQLFLYNFKEKSSKPITPFERAVQYSNPRFSPDGKHVAVSRWKNGQRDIIIVDLQGQVVTQVTDDEAVDMHPEFSEDGNRLYFTSDVTGVTNIWRYDMSSGVKEQVSNVLTGVFGPQIGSGKIFVQHYNGSGYDISSMNDQGAPLASDLAEADQADTAEKEAKEGEEALITDSDAIYKDLPPDEIPDVTLKPKKYNPILKLYPRYIYPGFFFTDDSVLLSANVGSSDPLAWHVWNASVTYRTDANFVGGSFLYSYNQLRPSIFLSFNDFVVNYGDLFRTGANFFEERLRGQVGASISAQAKGTHRLTGYYFFERRSAESPIPAGAVLPPTLGNFSGFGMRYRFNRATRQAGDISLEGGPRLIMDFQFSDAALGSSEPNEQIIFSGDLREYVKLPMDGHVLAFRLAGGIAFGDQLLQGTFRLGSATGESIISGPTPRLFTLRGLPQITFAGERALLLSGEYRLPLIYPQRGAGTGPIFLKRLHMAFFADYGSVFNGDIDFNNFLLGVGAELRADLVLFYGLPITGRLGYGIIVSGRQFIQGFTDPITGSAIKNGALILELGTSF